MRYLSCVVLWVKDRNKYGGSKNKCMATGDGGSGKAMDASDIYGERNTNL